MAKNKRNIPAQTGPPDHAAQLIYVLNTFHPISADISDYLYQHSFVVSYRKGKLLLKSGSVCPYIYFIKKGAIRGYVQEGKKDITTWITAENEMVTSINSFDLQTPAMENIQALE